jgi:hypothetical protein
MENTVLKREESYPWERRLLMHPGRPPGQEFTQWPTFEACTVVGGADKGGELDLGAFPPLRSDVTRKWMRRRNDYAAGDLAHAGDLGSETLQSFTDELSTDSTSSVRKQRAQ